MNSPTRKLHTSSSCSTSPQAPEAAGIFAGAPDIVTSRHHFCLNKCWRRIPSTRSSIPRGLEIHQLLEAAWHHCCSVLLLSHISISPELMISIQIKLRPPMFLIFPGNIDNEACAVLCHLLKELQAPNNLRTQGLSHPSLGVIVPVPRCTMTLLSNLGQSKRN